MPLHELYGMVKGKLDSKEMNTKRCVVDQSSLLENDFSELVWENGHISMLGQSNNIARKIPTYQIHKDYAKDVGYVNSNTNTNATNLRMLRFEGDLDSGLNEIRIQDEDVLPWLNYGIDDYSSDFLPELSGITMNDFSLLDKRSNCNQVFRESHTNSPSFALSVKSRVSNITENNSSNVGETTQTPSGSSSFSSLRMEKQDPIVSSNSCTIMNFSHFARPAAIVKSNLKNIDMGDMNKGNVATRSYHAESTRVVFSGECPKETACHVMEPSKVDLKPLESKSLELNAAVSKQCDHTCNEDVSKIDRASNLVLGENRIEPAVASSSVCSANSAERCSDDPNQCLKRKSGDTKDSECQSEDADEESVGVKKAAPARGTIGSKRSRSAEVHNLSERKRRDRINEKMRALQELIPNCNKVDKASMLDEAIEYLKTLQLQVQIMSMGAGLYMPAMVLPMGMQHMQASNMSPFSPMALQIGYGMRMHENNGGSSRFPMAQVPQIQGTNLLSGATDLHGMAARSYPQVFGIPNQGLSVPMPCSPLFPFQGEPLMNQSPLGLNTSATAGLMQTVDSVSTPSLKNPMPNVNSQVMQNTNACNSAIQMSNQCGATNVGFEHSANLVHNSGHACEANDIRVVNHNKEDNNLLIKKSCEL